MIKEESISSSWAGGENTIWYLSTKSHLENVHYFKQNEFLELKYMHFGEISACVLAMHYSVGFSPGDVDWGRGP